MAAIIPFFTEMSVEIFLFHCAPRFFHSMLHRQSLFHIFLLFLFAYFFLSKAKINMMMVWNVFSSFQPEHFFLISCCESLYVGIEPYMNEFYVILKVCKIFVVVALFLLYLSKFSDFMCRLIIEYGRVFMRYCFHDLFFTRVDFFFFFLFLFI